MDQIYTTHGWLDADKVELRVSSQEDDAAKVERTDKYIKATGEWVGNDLHVHIKQGPAIFAEAGSFS